MASSPRRLPWGKSGNYIEKKKAIKTIPAFSKKFVPAPPEGALTIFSPEASSGWPVHIRPAM
jgi:hypothetical protein